MDRRDVLRGFAVGALLASSQSASGCSPAEFEEDDWGERLVAFLRTGDDDLLDGLFADYSTLVAFDEFLIADSDQMFFQGSKAVKAALVQFRKQQCTLGFGDMQRDLQKVQIIGSKQQGRMNKIELIFATADAIETSCGPTRSEQNVDLFFEAGVHDSGDDWVKWSIHRIALLPRLDMVRQPSGA